MRLIAADEPEWWLQDVDDRLREDPRHVRIVGLFGAGGHPIVGNVERKPAGFAPNLPVNAAVVRIDDRGRETQNVRLGLRPLTVGKHLR